VTLLNSIGFEWKPKLGRGSDLDHLGWRSHFDRLKAFVDLNGHSRVPQSYHDSRLARFVWRQRYCFRRGELPADRVTLLNSIGFEWKPKRGRGSDLDHRLKAFVDLNGYASEQSWDSHFNDLKLYAAVNGHCNVPFNYSDKKLSNFVFIQKYHFRAGRLTPERTALLQSIGFKFVRVRLPSTGIPSVRFISIDMLRVVAGGRNQQTFKYFDIQKLGFDSAWKKACKARRTLLREYLENIINNRSLDSASVYRIVAKYRRYFKALRKAAPGTRIRGITRITEDIYLVGSTRFCVQKFGKERALELATSYAEHREASAKGCSPR
jgi:hypothetical protein